MWAEADETRARARTSLENMSDVLNVIVEVAGGNAGLDTVERVEGGAMVSERVEGGKED